MGHKEGHTLAYNHRLLVATQRSIGSFASLFSVLVVAWIFFLAAVHNRESPCQQRGHEARLRLFLNPELTVDFITFATISAFSSTDVTLTFDDDHHAPFLYQLMDTPRNVISGNGFRLIRWKDRRWVKWDLRTLSPQLCGAKPLISMEVLPNVDYEKVQYRSLALTLPHLYNHTRQYLLSSQLRTTDVKRISSFVQLESVFPGFYALSSGDDKLIVTQEYNVTRVKTGEAFFRESSLDIVVKLEEWANEDKRRYWILSLSTGNIRAQTALMLLQETLMKQFSESSLICRTKECTQANDQFML